MHVSKIRLLQTGGNVQHFSSADQQVHELVIKHRGKKNLHQQETHERDQLICCYLSCSYNILVDAEWWKLLLNHTHSACGDWTCSVSVLPLSLEGERGRHHRADKDGPTHFFHPNFRSEHETAGGLMMKSYPLNRSKISVDSRFIFFCSVATLSVDLFPASEPGHLCVTLLLSFSKES